MSPGIFMFPFLLSLNSATRGVCYNRNGTIQHVKILVTPLMHTRLQALPLVSLLFFFLKDKEQSRKPALNTLIVYLRLESRNGLSIASKGNLRAIWAILYLWTRAV